MTDLHTAIERRIDKLERHATYDHNMGYYRRATVNYPALMLAGLAECRDVLRRHHPIQELAVMTNHGSEWMTLCAYEWGDGDGHLLRWEQCPDIQSLCRWLGVEVQ